jgi:hypothetical protein
METKGGYKVATQIIKVRVGSPGTLEQHITEFMLLTGTIFIKSTMVLSIEMIPDTFYTTADRKKAQVIVAKTADGTKYVKTVGDSTTENNLLSLPRF